MQRKCSLKLGDKKREETFVKDIIQDFGNEKRGQKVFIKFNAYSFCEIGMIEGKVDFISKVSIKDSVFLGKTLFPKSLLTE